MRVKSNDSQGPIGALASLYMRTHMSPLGAHMGTSMAQTNKPSNIIISGVTDYLDMNVLGKNQNPTYEYWPEKPQGRITLDILNWAYPFYLFPYAFQLPGGELFLFVS